MFHRVEPHAPLPSLATQLGVRGLAQVRRDVATVLGRSTGGGFAVGTSSLALLRPRLSIPAWLGLVPDDRLAPIFNLFDRYGGGRDYHHRATRKTARDYRGGRLSYDEHDGTDFVCPRGTPMVAAAPGVLVAVRDTWLRGGLTACVDHGEGVVTQYTHLAKLLLPIGARVKRAEVIALSGVSGIDMTTFAPWVPPHLHFMVWVRGLPVDPFRAPDDEDRAGFFFDGNAPSTLDGPLVGDPDPTSLDAAVDAAALARVLGAIRSARLRREVDGAPDDAARVAILEDALHHERDDFEPSALGTPLRRATEPERVRISLPLPRSRYDGVRFGDLPGQTTP